MTMAVGYDYDDNYDYDDGYDYDYGDYVQPAELVNCHCVCVPVIAIDGNIEEEGE